MFSCKVCSHHTDNLKTFYAHAKSHRNLANYRFSCGIEHCPGNFRTFSALKFHMHRNHPPATTVSQRQSIYQHSGNCKCSVQGCDYVADNVSLLCIHLRLHIRNGKKVTCPFEGCSKYFRVRSSFAIHISRKHRQSFVAKPQAQRDTDVQVQDIQVHDVYPSLDSHGTNPDLNLNCIVLFKTTVQTAFASHNSTVHC